MNIYDNLDFNAVLDNVAAEATAGVTAKAVRQLLPSTDISVVKKLLTQTGNAISILASYKPDLAFYDIAEYVAKAKVGAVLSPAEFLRIKSNIRAMRSLKSCVTAVDDCDALKDIVLPVRICDELEYNIMQAVENDTDLKDGASEKLHSLRRAISRANARLKEQLDSFTRQSEISKYLQDNIVTIRGGRYVLPVRSECRSNIKGLLHDVSSTGATVFIEPFAVVEANNEIITLKTAEFNEVERILSELSKKTVAFSGELLSSQNALIQCGVIFAKAEYAKKIDAYRPILDIDGNISLLSARHPLIASADVVPIDIVFDKKRVLLISGPNTGGKTVALKTVGLFALMTACGMFIPASEGSTIGVFDDIFCDIGDSQSISQSLSTFSAHISNLKYITDRMNDKSLVLLDEVGDGTDPEEGAAIAVAIIKELINKRSTAVVTTHFNSVKEFALAASDISNASMQFDNINFRPTYKVLQGVSGSSYAIEIAEKLGLGRNIIENARNSLGREKQAFDSVMHEVEKLRNAALQDREEYEKLLASAKEAEQSASKLKTEYEAKLSEISENARAIIKRRADEFTERAEGLIEEIKAQLKAADEVALFNARKIVKRIGEDIPSEQVKPKISTAPLSPAQLASGMEVFITGLNKRGTVVGVCGNKATVAIGSIKTDVPIESLAFIDAAKEKPRDIVQSRRREPENKEIILLGKTVDEATAELDILLSDIASGSVLRIVHGKGTGALGKGIQAYLKRHRRIKAFRYGRYGEGDSGVTIAEVK